MSKLLVVLGLAIAVVGASGCSDASPAVDASPDAQAADAQPSEAQEPEADGQADSDDQDEMAPASDVTSVEPNPFDIDEATRMSLFLTSLGVGEDEATQAGSCVVDELADNGFELTEVWDPVPMLAMMRCLESPGRYFFTPDRLASTSEFIDLADAECISDQVVAALRLVDYEDADTLESGEMPEEIVESARTKCDLSEDQVTALRQA